jgi:hypothetical protein
MRFQPVHEPVVLEVDHDGRETSRREGLVELGD